MRWRWLPATRIIQAQSERAAVEVARVNLAHIDLGRIHYANRIAVSYADIQRNPLISRSDEVLSTHTLLIVETHSQLKGSPVSSRFARP